MFQKLRNRIFISIAAAAIIYLAFMVYVDYESPAGVADAIRQMVVRGAPAIGVAAAYGLATAARNSTAEHTQDLLEELQQAGAMRAGGGRWCRPPEALDTSTRRPCTGHSCRSDWSR